MLRKVTLKSPDDYFWLHEKGERAVEIRRSQLSELIDYQADDCSVVMLRGQSSKSAQCLESLKSRIESYSNLERFNQLGIKDHLLQRSDKDRHSRMRHCYGTALVGLVYLEALDAFRGNTVFSSLNRERIEPLLEFALLLHDIGHLPFSHLMEEVFAELNWTRMSGRYHRHDDVPIEQLSDSDKEHLRSALGSALGRTDGASNQEFEMLQDLVAGISGVPFLDAIVNSAVDADKIDYIFRDMKFTQAATRLRTTDDWLQDFMSNISLSTQGLVRLNGEAALCALELLRERQFLYERLYLNPQIRVFEKLASTVLASWLTARIFGMGPSPGTQDVSCDLRSRKGAKAYEQLIAAFRDETEFSLLKVMCQELADETCTFRDPEARNWFGEIQQHFEDFDNGTGDGILKRKANEMMVREPLTIAGNHVEDARRIARDLYVDYPCGVLIDVAEFPDFLPSPPDRRFKMGGDTVVAEQFLVPDQDIRRWSRSGVGRFPLHKCDFTAFENKTAQVVVINTRPGAMKGDYVYDLFVHRCCARGIEPMPLGERGQ